MMETNLCYINIASFFNAIFCVSWNVFEDLSYAVYLLFFLTEKL